MQDPAALVKLLVLDVDGVLTDGTVAIDHHGHEIKQFNTRDGLGLRIWMRLGGEVAIITGRQSLELRHRCAELGIRHIFQAVGDKRATFGELVRTLDVAASHTAVMGDDLPDLPMLRLAGYPMAVADAAPEVREAASFVTTADGGRGAVREATEHLLKAQDRWEDALALFDG
jgi:3-deoxy-D-manno-octulosonate 8-phosphate phosphatase (KDO 8-P phosphatase)